MVIGLLLVSIVAVILRALPAASFDQIDGFLSVTAHVTNIFSWSQQFLPVGLIATLLTITALMYTGKMLWALVKLIVSFFK